MRRVVILQEVLAAYRVEFYEQLRAGLADEGVELVLAHGAAAGDRAMRGDEASLSWAHLVGAWRPRLPGAPVWLKAWRLSRGADLVIVEHANRQLINYPLLLLSRLGHGRLAFWGHGANLQAHSSRSVAERLKRWTARGPHWWFAYTEGSAQRVARHGFASNRITVVQNAIDTTGLSSGVRAVTEQDLADFRRETRTRQGSTALFIGALYQEKRLPFLLEAAARVHQRCPGFVLLIGGDGPARQVVERAQERVPHVRYLGRLDGERRHLALRAADVVLMPGLVGLAVLDAFAAATPLITTAVGYHSPEIEYLEHGVNGLCLPNPADVDAFADCVVELLQNDVLLQSLRAGCVSAATRITTEAMVDRFRAGILEALETTGSRR